MGLLDPQLSVYFIPQLLHTDRDRKESLREGRKGEEREREREREDLTSFHCRKGSSQMSQ